MSWFRNEKKIHSLISRIPIGKFLCHADIRPEVKSEDTGDCEPYQKRIFYRKSSILSDRKQWIKEKNNGLMTVRSENIDLQGYCQLSPL